MSETPVCGEFPRVQKAIDVAEVRIVRPVQAQFETLQQSEQLSKIQSAIVDHPVTVSAKEYTDLVADKFLEKQEVLCTHPKVEEYKELVLNKLSDVLSYVSQTGFKIVARMCGHGDLAQVVKERDDLQCKLAALNNRDNNSDDSEWAKPDLKPDAANLKMLQDLLEKKRAECEMLAQQLQTEQNKTFYLEGVLNKIPAHSR